MTALMSRRVRFARRAGCDGRSAAGGTRSTRSNSRRQRLRGKGPERCAPPQREIAFARGTRSHRSAFAIKLQATSHECHSERSEESLIISGTDLISTARDVSPLLNMTARFPTIGLSFLLLTAFLQRFYFCQIVSRIAVVRVDPQCRFEFFYRLRNSTHQCQSSSQIIVRVGRIRIHAQGLLIMVDCL